MKKLDRRSFIKRSLLTTASLSVLPAFSQEQRKATVQAQASAQARVIGANSDVRYAVVGFKGRGGDHLGGMRKVKGTRLVALCDVDKEVLEREAKKSQDNGEKVQGYTDIRKLLENPDIDVVTFATPNHWHSLGAIWAIQAGKDVYVEKPVSHNVWEGRQLVIAARKYNRIVQTGTQIRSNPGMREAMAWLHAGNLGKTIRARGLCYKRRDSIGKVDGPQSVPETIDYDLWCGPAPKTPLTRKRLHYDWHWVWETGNGDLGNQGIHQMDVARWALQESELSPRILTVGGRLGYQDDGTTPNTLIVFHDYKTAPLIFEVRGLPSADGSTKMDNYRGAGVGIAIDCENGSMVIPSYERVVVYDKDGKQIKEFGGGASHYENFIKAVQSRKHSDLNADVLEGHLSSALCHTGNISYLLGKPQSPDAIRETVKGNTDLAEAYGRMEEHVTANKVDLALTPVTLGAVLKMDPKNERFIGNPQADQLLTREYRKPFVVPEKV
jgi:predicted dehydrogenase